MYKTDKGVSADKLSREQRIKAALRQVDPALLAGTCLFSRSTNDEDELPTRKYS